MMGETPCVGLIGCGRWGRHIARVLEAQGALAAIAARRLGRAREAAAGLGVEALDVAGLLARDDIEAVAIATPPQAHRQLASAALAAGKHVFVEKPLALSVADAAALKAAAKAADRTLMVGHIMRHNLAFIALAELIRDGAIGRVRTARSVRYVTRADIDPLWMLAPHDASMLLALLGRPLTVRGRRSRGVHAIRLVFEAAVTAEIEVGGGASAKRSELTVEGDDGVVVFEDTAGPGRKLRLNGEPIALAEREPLAAEMDWFLAAVRGERPPLADAAEGLAVVELLERAGA